MKNTLFKDGAFLSLLGVFLLLPWAHVKVTWFGVPLYLPEIAIVCALCWYGWRCRTYPTAFQGERRVDAVFAVGALLFVSGAILSYLSNPLSLTGLGMLKSWFVLPLMGAWLVYYEAQDPKKRLWFVAAWFTALLLTALVSLMYLWLGMMTYDNRLAGMYTSPNFLAIFLSPGILLAWLLLSYCHGKTRQRIWWSLCLAGGSLVMLISVYHTRSYGAWAALLVASVLVWLGQWCLSRHAKEAVIMLCVLAVIGGSSLLVEHESEKWQALSSFEERSSLSSRLMIWRAAEKILADHWLLGIGPGKFQETYLDYQRYFPPYLEWAVPEPHNWYFAVALSTGMVGLIGFAVLMARFLFLQGSIFWFAGHKEKRLFALIMAAAMVLYLVYGLTDTPYFKNDLALSFWLLLALGLSLVPGEVSSAPQRGAG